MTFTVYPAIDLRQGRVVRLQQGKATRETTYSDDPVKVATGFEAEGAKWLHVVNLDGAFSKRAVGTAGKNLKVLKALCEAVKIPIQFGGGLRDERAVERALEIGVSRVVLGTVAVRQPEIVEQLAPMLGDKLAVGIDAKDGKVAVSGWVETTDVDAADLARRMIAVGVKRFIYTDIARDGMLGGPDVAGARKLADLGCHVILSGGVGSSDDVKAARAAGGGVEGVIIGKALYDEKLTLKQALATAAG